MYGSRPQLVHDVGEAGDDLATGAEGVGGVDVLGVVAPNEVVPDLDGVAEALYDAAHEAGVSHVGYARVAGTNKCIRR